MSEGEAISSLVDLPKKGKAFVDVEPWISTAASRKVFVGVERWISAAASPTKWIAKSPLTFHGKPLLELSDRKVRLLHQQNEIEKPLSLNMICKQFIT
jgi:hypothetical protein